MSDVIDERIKEKSLKLAEKVVEVLPEIDKFTENMDSEEREGFLIITCFNLIKNTLICQKKGFNEALSHLEFINGKMQEKTENQKSN